MAIGTLLRFVDLGVVREVCPFRLRRRFFLSTVRRGDPLGTWIEEEGQECHAEQDGHEGTDQNSKAEFPSQFHLQVPYKNGKNGQIYIKFALREPM